MKTTSIFTVLPEHVGRLTPAQAVDFVSQLLWAEAMRKGIPTSNVHISSNVTSKDGGIDATIDTGDVDIADSFLWDGRSGLQLKAGVSFSPTETQIRKELFGDQQPSREALGDAVRACLDSEGTYILVCLGVDPTPDKLEEAENLLETLFKQCDYVDPYAAVWGQRQLIGFLERFPSLALWINGNGGSPFQTHQSWSREGEMERPFKPGESQLAFMRTLREGLSQNDAAVHIRVRGEAGIGKTRLVLEAVRADELRPLVVYCEHPRVIRDSALLNTILRDDNQFNVVLVVDECDVENMGRLWDQLQHRGPRVRMVTIYNEFDDGGGTTKRLDAPPLDAEQAAEILREYGVPDDQVGRWAELCEGSPRWAHVIGGNLRSNPEDVLKDADTVALVDRYIAGAEGPSSAAVDERRVVLRYVALFKRFGFGASVVAEAKAIHALVQGARPEITWPKFQEIVEYLRSRKILQGETTLYITPKAFHVKLWVQWWQIYGQGFQLAEFTRGMPERLLDWFLEMFKFAAQSPVAFQVSEELLREIQELGRDSGVFESRRASRFFLALTEAAPEASLRVLRATVGTWDADRLRTFTTGRRDVVWALERIAVWRELFPDAARLLLALAEAENETWSNNATGVFADLFTLATAPIAPTEAPPEERFPVLREALESSSPKRREIALLACEHALQNGMFSRAIGSEYQGLKRQPELWSPKTWGEIFDAYRRVWHFLVERLDRVGTLERDAIVEVLLKRTREVNHIRNLSNMVSDTIGILAQRSDIDKKLLIEVVEDILHHDRPSLDAEQLIAWEALQRNLVGDDFHSQMQRYVAIERFEDSFGEDGKRVDKVTPRIQALAQQAIEHPELLEAEYDWLLSKSAQNGYRFGYELGRRDRGFTLLQSILKRQPSTTGTSPFFLGGYLLAIYEQDVEAWEALLDGLAKDEFFKAWVPELTWRTALTDRAANRVLTLVREGAAPLHSLRMFGYGRSFQSMSREIVEEWMGYLLSLGTRDAASIALDLFGLYYTESRTAIPEELTRRLLTAQGLFKPAGQKGRDDDYEWSQIAKVYVEVHPHRSVELAQIILQHFGGDDTILDKFRSPIHEVLTDILRRYPGEVWAIAASFLGPPIDSRAFSIRHWLREGALSVVPREFLWKWVDDDVERRSWYLASFIPASISDLGDRGSLAREILVRYGDRQDVRNNLSANLSTETWWGPESRHHQGKRDLLAEIRKGETDPKVLRWLNDYISGLEHRIREAKIQEEREDR